MNTSIPSTPSFLVKSYPGKKKYSFLNAPSILRTSILRPNLPMNKVSFSCSGIVTAFARYTGILRIPLTGSRSLIAIK